MIRPMPVSGKRCPAPMNPGRRGEKYVFEKYTNIFHSRTVFSSSFSSERLMSARAFREAKKSPFVLVPLRVIDRCEQAELISSTMARGAKAPN